MNGEAKLDQRTLRSRSVAFRSEEKRISGATTMTAQSKHASLPHGVPLPKLSKGILSDANRGGIASVPVTPSEPKPSKHLSHNPMHQPAKDIASWEALVQPEKSKLGALRAAAEAIRMTSSLRMTPQQVPTVAKEVIPLRTRPVSMGTPSVEHAAHVTVSRRPPPPASSSGKGTGTSILTSSPASARSNRLSKRMLPSIPSTAASSGVPAGRAPAMSISLRDQPCASLWLDSDSDYGEMEDDTETAAGTDAGGFEGDGWKDFDTVAVEAEAEALPAEPEVEVLEVEVQEIVEEEDHSLEDAHVITSLEETSLSLLLTTRAVLTSLTDLSPVLAVVDTMFPSVIAQPLRAYAPPLLMVIEILLAVVLLVLEIAAEGLLFVWTRVRPYRPGLFLMSMGGLTSCLFGGFFPLTIAALEAFALCGYSTTLASLRKVAEDGRKFMIQKAALDKDAGTSPMVLNQAYLLLSSIDPTALSEAIVGLNSGLLAVLATLKMQFAKTITLGNALSTSLEPLAQSLAPYLAPCLGKMAHWSPSIIRWSTKLLAISIAWKMRRVFAAYHSSLRGGQAFVRYFLRYLITVKLIPASWASYVNCFAVLGYAVALGGLWFQLTSLHGLPFPLNWLLFPCVCLENALLWVVSHSAYLPAM